LRGTRTKEEESADVVRKNRGEGRVTSWKALAFPFMDVRQGADNGELLRGRDDQQGAHCIALFTTLLTRQSLPAQHKLLVQRREEAERRRAKREKGVEGGGVGGKNSRWSGRGGRCQEGVHFSLSLFSISPVLFYQFQRLFLSLLALVFPSLSLPNSPR
jgi:hypothetical protein